MIHPVHLRSQGRALAGSVEVRGTCALLSVEGRAIEGTCRREGPRFELARRGRTVHLHVASTGHAIWVALEGRTWVFEVPRGGGGPGPAETAENEVRAPMTARVVSVAAAPGAEAREGDLLVTLEAMKMEFRLAAPFAARVEEVLCREGDRVDVGQLLVRLEPAGGAP